MVKRTYYSFIQFQKPLRIGVIAECLQMLNSNALVHVDAKKLAHFRGISMVLTQQNLTVG